MQIELTGWPALLPAIGPFAFRVSPAGLVEWLPEASALPPDLRVAIDAANPALALTRVVAGERPAITVSGDAAFASDIDWLIDNLRWDLQDDLARLVGDAPARQLGKVGGWLAGALREGAKALRDLAARGRPTAAPPPLMRHLARLVVICVTVLRYGLDELALSSFRQPWVRFLVRVITIGRRLDAPRGVRLRLGLERLGPIFVKFGQVLSTRRDLLPTDIADELARLQDRVPPFPAEVARAIVERAFGRPLDAIFASFDAAPVASASIAQVHFAVLKDGREVAVKVLRPGMLAAIDDDVEVMRQVARVVERWSADGKRLKPRQVVAEFDKYLHDELDLVREAANAAQLRRNMQSLGLVLVPEMVWELCTQDVIVMERMDGVPISQVQRLRDAGVDIPKLARDGVTIFFTQVFRDGFFHADMHPGNIQVSIAPETFGRYISLDFGIVGTLTEFDKDYLAQNFIAFFHRDYKRVAELHVESGWVPPADAHRRARGRDPRRLRAAVRPAAEGHLARPGAAAPVPDLAPLQRRDPAAARAAAEDAAQHRGPRPRPRPRARPLEHRQALPRALDGRAGRLARPGRAAEEGGAALRPPAAAAAAPAPRRAAAAGAGAAALPRGAPGRAAAHQPAADRHRLHRARLLPRAWSRCRSSSGCTSPASAPAGREIYTVGLL